MNEELKPCPFCGGEAEIYFFERKGYLPTCLNCQGMIEYWFDTKQQATEAWNRRVADEREIFI